MLRAAILALLASPAAAATLPAIQIEECHMVTTRAETFTGPAVMMTERGSRGLVCGPPMLEVNPFPYDPWGDLKFPQFVNESQYTALELDQRGQTRGPVPNPRHHPFGAVTGSRFFSTHTASGCCERSWKPEPVNPVPVPIPASLPLYAALMGAVTIFTRRRKK